MHERILTDNEVEMLRDLGMKDKIEEKTVFVLKQEVRKVATNKNKKKAKTKPRIQYEYRINQKGLTPDDAAGFGSIVNTAARQFLSEHRFLTEFHTPRQCEEWLMKQTLWNKARVANTVYRLFYVGFFERREVQPKNKS